MCIRDRPYGELAKQLLRLENDLGWKMMKERWNSKVAAWREQLKVLGKYQGYLCGPKADGEVVAEKLLTIHAQLKPKSMTDAFKAAADAWRAALHPLLHPADHPSGRASAPRRDDIGADELEPLVHQLLDGVAWPPD